tara:strand:- start:4325 stop:7405 length:3081 start_codon:yes stop_codon:yes gene_type:complete
MGFLLTASLSAAVIDTALFQAMEWRNIGPFRGGRSTTVAGVVNDNATYYFGATGGGVWKTNDAGISWRNVSDGHFGVGSIGAIAVSPSDPNTVYVGTGTACVRGVSSSHGDGVYKSVDGGETWSHLGLKNTRQISKVIVHPDNPDLVYVAAQGTPWTGSKERGIFRSTDGGKSWKKILFIDELASASGLSMDMTNPRVLYAAFWQHQRLPWHVRSGGPGSGIHKSTDGGDTWKKLENGLPESMGKTAVSVSPANPKRVWVLTESDKWGLYRSDDGGKSFSRINKERVLISRSWYYIHVFADPQDENTVYVLNAPMMKSTDGGRTFKNIRVPHGDNHDLWINPENNQIMINANDGGANVSFNGGITWSTQQNQPTAQFYRVITDNRFPYYVYGGQQDNSSVAIASRARGGIDWKDWYPVAGCESAYLAFDPDNPVLVYGGCYQGLIDELNVKTGNERSIMAYEYLGLGSDPIDQKYRFNWNAPIVASPHDPNVIYHAGNVVLKTTDRGESWEVISPDLTLNKKENLGRGGSPITNEAAGGEIYHTILYLEASEHHNGTLWVGTDDGLVHVTNDGGKSWKNVTPNGMKEGMVNTIDVSPQDPATATIAFTRYKFGDFTPYIYRTTNFGKSWNKITRGIPEDAYVRVVREDAVRSGLLYAGTELGMFISFNDGKEWQPFQLNLPIVPITDLTIRNNDLVASTLGRAFWILDDLSPLQTMSADLAKEDLHLFSPRETHLISYGGRSDGTSRGKNPPSGVVFQYILGSEEEETEGLQLSIVDSRGDTVRTFSSEDGEPEMTRRGIQRTPGLDRKNGMNRFVWNMRRENLTSVPNLFASGSRAGYRVGPGKYTASMTLSDKQAEVSFEIVHDPRSDQSANYRKQQQILGDLYDTANELYVSINSLRSMRSQLKSVMKKVKGMDGSEQLFDVGKSAVEALSEWEKSVVSLKLETFQDVVNFDSGLDADITELMSKIDGSGPLVSEGSEDRFDDLMDLWDEKDSQLEDIVEEQVGRFNELYRELDVPAVILPKN